jgi:hypothetical protein
MNWEKVLWLVREQLRRDQDINVLPPEQSKRKWKEPATHSVRVRRWQQLDRNVEVFTSRIDIKETLLHSIITTSLGIAN